MLEELKQGEDGEMDVKEKPVGSRVHSQHLPRRFFIDAIQVKTLGYRGPVTRELGPDNGLAPESLFTTERVVILSIRVTGVCQKC